MTARLNRALSAVITDAGDPKHHTQRIRAERLIALYGRDAALRLIAGRVRLAIREQDMDMRDWWASVSRLVEGMTDA